MSHTITNDMFVENIDLLVTVEIVSFYKNSAINFQSICSFLLQSPKLIEIKFSYSDEAIDQLVDTLSCSENLRKLDVRTLEKLNTGQSLLTLMQKVPNLTDINLPYHLSADDVKLIPYESLLAISFGGYHTSEHFLEELCINCPHLCSINISSCDLNNSHIEVLVRYHKNMQSLMLTVDQDMHEGLVPLVAISTSLEYLSLDSPFITDLTVNALATHCPRLKCLMLDRSPTISSRAMADLLHRCSKLEQLHLPFSCCVNDALLFVLSASCRSLLQLVIHGAQVTDTGILALAAALPGLQSLDLSSCHGISDASVQAVCYHCRDLRELFLDDLDLTDASAEAMTQYLRKLRVFGGECDNISTYALHKVVLANPKVGWI